MAQLISLPAFQGMLGANLVRHMQAPIDIAIHAEEILRISGIIHQIDPGITPEGIVQILAAGMDLIQASLGDLDQCLFLQNGCAHIVEFMAVFIGNTIAAGAIIKRDMLVAECGGGILPINHHCFISLVAGAIGSDVIHTGFRSQLTGLQADGNAFHQVGIIQGDGFQTLVDLQHDLLPQSGGRADRRAGKNDLLRLLKARPNGSRVVAGVSCKVQILVGVGCTGLTGHIHTQFLIHIGRSTGTGGHNAIQAVVDIVHSFFAEDTTALLLILNNYLALIIQNHREGSGLTPNTLIGKGGISGGDITDSQTLRQATHGQRCNADIRQGATTGGNIVIHQTGQAQLLLAKIKAVLGTHQLQHIGSHRIVGIDDTTPNCTLITINIIMVDRIGVLVRTRVVQGQIVDNGSGGDQARLKSRGIDRHRLNRRTDLLGVVRCVVGSVGDGFGARIASHSHNVAGGIINDHDGRVQLAAVLYLRDLIHIGVDLIHSLLNLSIIGGINMIAGAADQIHIVLTGSTGAPFHTVTLCQGLHHILQHSIHIPGVDAKGSIHSNIDFTATVRAIINAVAVFSLRIIGDKNQITNRALIAAALHQHITIGIQLTLTAIPAVLLINAALIDQLIVISIIVFLIREPPLHMHLSQNDLLAVTVTACAIPLLILAGQRIDLLGIGIKHRGVIGNADQRSQFRSIEVLQFLTEVMLRGTLDTIAAGAKIDCIHIVFEYNLFTVGLLELQ